MAVFNCPQCGHLQNVDDKYVGRNASCPKCKTQGVVWQAQKAPSDVSEFSETEAKRVVHASQGPLGIRCDGWMNHESHINKRSSLRVEWWTLIDETMPLTFSKPCGLEVHNVAEDYPLQTIYQADTVVMCVAEPITAFEVKYLTFNVWGEHACTLNALEILDMDGGTTVRRKHRWNLFSQNDAEEFCASLGFVSRVRMASGAVRVADSTFVLREAQRFTEKFTVEDLEPKAPKRQ